MLVVVSELVSQLFSPLGVFFCCILFASFIRARFTRISRAAYLFGVATLLVFSLPVVANSLYRSIEAIHPALPRSGVPVVDSIVVLGGSVEPPIYPRQEVEFGVSGDRVFYAWRLLQAGKATRIIVSGGARYNDTSLLPEASYMKDILLELGVAEDRILLETQSRSTVENAVNTRRLLEFLDSEKPQKTYAGESMSESVSRSSAHSVLLVTSAKHMPRALATFQKLGFNVFAASTDIRQASNGAPTWLAWIPNAFSLARSTEVLREWVGLWWYRSQGWAV